MSAILSADDLNDFISPGVACIKPVETLPQERLVLSESGNEYEVTTEDKLASLLPSPPAQISLTDCLACSGCVTSAEAILVSLQSHQEVLDTLDKYSSYDVSKLQTGQSASFKPNERIFVASISPQARASLAATYNVSERQAGHMISQLLQGPHGVRNGGQRDSAFSWIIDTNAIRDLCLVASVKEVQQALSDDSIKKPILSSICPGWICYAEKTHPHVLPHLSKLKSPQAMTGTLIKSVLARRFGVSPENVWHMALMPCFDKKLEGARSELTSHTWHGTDGAAIRDVDCVITARELLMLAESRNVSFACLPRTRLSTGHAPVFPDNRVQRLLSRRHYSHPKGRNSAAIGTSGGFLHHMMKTRQAQVPHSTIRVQPGRNADVDEHILYDSDEKEIFRAARYYGFRNIQNLVRRLKPAKPSRVPGANRRPTTQKAGVESDGDYAYVEVMACPGGCTNGGGQIKIGDVATLRQIGGTGIVNGGDQEVLPAQKEWLAKVDEAYWSASDSDDGDNSLASTVDSGVDSDVQMGDSSEFERLAQSNVVDGIDHTAVTDFLQYWSDATGVELDKLIYTTFREVESDVGKKTTSKNDAEKVAGLAVQLGGGW